MIIYTVTKNNKNKSRSALFCHIELCGLHIPIYYKCALYSQITTKPADDSYVRFFVVPFLRVQSFPNRSRPACGEHCDSALTYRHLDPWAPFCGHCPCCLGSGTSMSEVDRDKQAMTRTDDRQKNGTSLSSSFLPFSPAQIFTLTWTLLVFRVLLHRCIHVP